MATHPVHWKARCPICQRVVTTLPKPQPELEGLTPEHVQFPGPDIFRSHATEDMSICPGSHMQVTSDDRNAVEYPSRPL